MGAPSRQNSAISVWSGVLEVEWTDPIALEEAKLFSYEGSVTWGGRGARYVDAGLLFA